MLSGDLPIAKLLISRGFRPADSPTLVGVAAYNGHLELLQWLVGQKYHGEERIPLSKHLNVNMWLVESGLECRVGEAFANACAEGPLPVLWWLVDYITTRGIVLGMDTATSAMELAATNGHLEVVKWLIEHDLGRDSTSAVHFAALNGHLEVAKYLHAQGFTGCNQITLRMAASGGHLAVLQWLYTRSKDDPKADLFGVHGRDRFIPCIPPLASEMTDAARNGHLEVVQYLHPISLTLLMKKRKRGQSSQHSCDLKMDNVVAGAAGGGHLDIVKWLCTHTTKEAMAYAASEGHPPVVKWLPRPNTFKQR